MSCIALSVATEGLARPVLAMSGCTSLLHGSPETSCCGTSIPRFSTRLSSGIAKGEQAAPGGTAGFCFPGLLPQSQCGSPSQKAALGAWEQPSLASVPAECPE